MHDDDEELYKKRAFANALKWDRETFVQLVIARRAYFYDGDSVIWNNSQFADELMEEEDVARDISLGIPDIYGPNVFVNGYDIARLGVDNPDADYEYDIEIEIKISNAEKAFLAQPESITMEEFLDQSIEMIKKAIRDTFS